MRKNRKYESNSGWLAAVCLIMIAAVSILWGRREHLYHDEVEEEILKEQKISTDELPAKVKSEETVDVSETFDTLPDSIRVLLTDADSSYEHSQVILKAPGGIRITGDITMQLEPEAEADLSELLPNQGCITVSPVEANDKIQILSMKKNQGVPSYEGILEIERCTEGYRIINKISLEAYLKYVIPSEMPAGYPMEALCAQAVCSRTYAVKQIEEGRLASYGADVDDTVSFQVYNNINSQPSTDEAAARTQGKVMRYDGQPIEAYFFSTSCGYTSTDEVWSTLSPSPYLRTASLSERALAAMTGGEMADETKLSESDFRTFLLESDIGNIEKDESWYRWQISFPYEQLQSQVDKICPEIGHLKGLHVIERSDGGAVLKMEAEGDAGNSFIETEYNVREFFSPGITPVIKNDGSPNTAMQILPSAYFVIDPVYEEEELTGFHILGGGYGHGVGMSQNGAKTLANQGMGWEEILNIFYKDITIH
jgi:stage II sporulation protein D